MKFENVRVYNFEGALRGMRNPKESWNLSDSVFGLVKLTEDCGTGVAAEWAKTTDRSQAADFITDNDILFDWTCWLWRNGILQADNNLKFAEVAFIGPKDMKLAQSLIKAGSEHRKFMRQIFVSVDITAPIFWWKEFDTYKVGTVANSTSTMHKIMSKEITLDSFEINDFNNIPYIKEKQRKDLKSPIDEDFVQMCLIPYMEYLRTSYLEIDEVLKQPNLTDDLKVELHEQQYTIWKELIRWLPESWLQTRTVTMNYENLFAMCSRGQRRFHKLVEWSGDGGETDSFIQFARRLPYAQELIFLDEIMQ